jgi:dienelactone hydrolase
MEISCIEEPMKASCNSRILCAFVTLVFLLSAPSLVAQFTYTNVRPVLQRPLLPHDVLLYQLQHYLLARIAQPPTPASEAAWTQDAEKIRGQFLQRMFHGWPQEWIDSPPAFVEVGVIETGKGYRIRKFRYEIVPGFYTGALLYEPEQSHGRMPGILNLLGHDHVNGITADYMQKICINFAKQQVMALSLEWIDMGELNTSGNDHTFGAHLNLVGLQEDGLFYLAMRKGLDYLASHPNVDPNRLGVTGLSGGGWQTSVLSGLDKRVAVAVPVAGYSSLQQRVEEQEDKSSIGDLEQVSPDFFDGYDYSHLTGLRAPRPTLLIYNVNDDCCFRAALTKPLVFNAIRPIFKLYGKEDALSWYVNEYPGTHNYQRDNREQAYRFFGKYLQTPLRDKEIVSDDEIRTPKDLAIGYPSGNLTLLSLAQKIADGFHRSPIPAAGTARDQWSAQKRDGLRTLLHYKPTPLARAWHVDTTHQAGINSMAHIFEMEDGLNLSGILVNASDVDDTAPATLVLDDRGRGMAFAEVSDRVDRGEQVLAANLLFTDEKAITKDAQGLETGGVLTTNLAVYAMVFDTVGDRTLGIEAAEVIELAKWLRARSHRQAVRIESRGIRSQTVALLAAALEPALFSGVVTRQGMTSFDYLIDRHVAFEDAPDLFCLDLYKEFDIDDLEAMAGTVLRSDPLGTTATSNGK